MNNFPDCYNTLEDLDSAIQVIDEVHELKMSLLRSIPSVLEADDHLQDLHMSENTSEGDTLVSQSVISTFMGKLRRLSTEFQESVLISNHVMSEERFRALIMNYM